MCRSAAAQALCNTVTELVAGDHTVVSHYMIEREDMQAFNVSTLRIQQGRSANVASHSVLIGGALVRNNVHPVLAGRRRRVPDQRPLHRQRAAASRQLHAGGTRQPALRAAGSSTTAFSTATRTAFFTAASSCTKTRRKPTPSRPIATCCFPIRRRSTPSRSWKSTPTT